MDPAEEARQWALLKQRFRDAGVPLTAQQEAQMQAAQAELQADLNQEFESNPNGAFARFFALAMLPAPISAPFAENLLGKSMIAYMQSTDQILTPAQRQIWEQRFSNQG